MKTVILFVSPLLLLACGNVETYHTLRDKNIRQLTGKRITVVGEATDYKIGPAVITEDLVTIFIDNLESWPEEYYLKNDSSKTIRITGKLIVKKDLPVFIQREGEPIRQGIPMPEGTDLKEARKRYVLKNATWKFIKK